MVVNPLQTKLFPLTSCRREKKGKGGGGGASEGPILYFEILGASRAIIISFPDI